MTTPSGEARTPRTRWVTPDELRQLQVDADYVIAHGDEPMEVSATLVWTLARQAEAATGAVADALAALRPMLEEVRLHVTVGIWYDDPANDRGGAAVARLHAAERELLKVYEAFGLPLGDHYAAAIERAGEGG